MIPSAGKSVEQRNSRSLLVGKKNGVATLEDVLAVSYVIKHALTQSSSHTPSYLKESRT